MKSARVGSELRGKLGKGWSDNLRDIMSIGCCEGWNGGRENGRLDGCSVGFVEG